ncbi:MAG: DedA family protein [Magnetococcales bacterium]|nr:DedA family protein [Magnetococcales bacterium]MBF0151130.1 DedA family protein [Magnetococcales bacterium]MBF0174711.1 DedA family protein [Magnetococcales bacterium]MBF0346790.1 DedA family protein [Magnetococcales bacterium]MBF0630963.1 DedA family protein [Magnetococcales bacterium]
MEAFLLEYGYLVLFIGTFLEGETILLVAAYLASRGYLDLWMSILVAGTGTFLGDQLTFWIGRRLGKEWFWKRERRWTKGVRRVLELIQRWDIWFVLSYRFFYGVRNVSSFALGMSDLSFIRFLVLNFMASSIWALSFGFAGYFFGKAVNRVLSQVMEYEMYILSGLGILALTIWLINRLAAKKKQAM